MIEFVRRLAIEHSFQIASAALAYLVGRWLLDLSTPEEDWETFLSWCDALPSWPDLRWYRYPEYLHQVRGQRLLATV